MGVKSPVMGVTGLAEAEAVGIGVALSVGVGDGVAVGVGVGVPVGVGVAVGLVVLPDGEATKAGASPACTTKFLVKVLVIPEVSIQEIVIEWAPSERFVGGLQLQDPLLGIWMVCEVGWFE